MHKHCGYCGHQFDPQAAWPRTCTACGETTWLNPLPVVVTLVPVGAGLLVVRRGIEPGKGQLALPGGFQVVGETWQEAGAREVFEETGLVIDAAGIKIIDVETAGRQNLTFGMASNYMGPLDFKYDHETIEALVITEPVETCFPLHTKYVARFFDPVDDLLPT